MNEQTNVPSKNEGIGKDHVHESIFGQAIGVKSKTTDQSAADTTRCLEELFTPSHQNTGQQQRYD